MGKRSRGTAQPLPAVTPGGQMKAQQLVALLESAAKTTRYDQRPQLWDQVLTVLNLDLCYQVAIADVLRRGTWRKAANPRAYIASAAVRSARGKKLLDYSDSDFVRVLSDEPNNEVSIHVDFVADFDFAEWGGGGVYVVRHYPPHRALPLHDPLPNHHRE